MKRDRYIEKIKDIKMSELKKVTPYLDELELPPRMRRFAERVEIPWIYHSDGNVIDIVGDLIEAGLDILNPLQPEALDIDAIHKRYGDRLSFDGCIGTQSTMPWGTAEDVRARVKQVIEKYGQNGGLFIKPTHVLEPEVPLENIDALFDACREYGTFE